MPASLRTIGRPKVEPSKRAKLKRPEKRTDAFYLSEEWRSLVEAIKRTRGRFCEDGKHPAHLPRTGVRLFGDHIRELKDGGSPLDPRNVRLLCSSCHARKTAEARARRYHQRASG